MTLVGKLDCRTVLRSEKVLETWLVVVVGNIVGIVVGVKLGTAVGAIVGRTVGCLEGL